jgi:hypothetical protein
MSTRINAARLPRVLSGTSDRGQMSLRGHLVIHARSPNRRGSRHALPVAAGPVEPSSGRLSQSAWSAAADGSSEQVGQLVTDCRGGDSHR